MNYFKEILKCSLLFFVVGILIEIANDFLQDRELEVTLSDLIIIVITGILTSIFIVSLSYQWKKYYKNKKPQC